MPRLYRHLPTSGDGGKREGMWGSDLRARERVGRWMATAGGAWRRQCVQAAESFRRAQQADRPAARHLPWPGLFADQFLSAGQAVRLRKHRPDSAARCPARRACASSCDGLPLNPELTRDEPRVPGCGSSLGEHETGRIERGGTRP